MTEAGKSQFARRWLELDLQLALLGCDERRRQTVRAWRDPRRPRIYDRHLAVPVAAPEGPERDFRALDEFYAETGAAQWSVYGLEGPLMNAWERAAVPQGLVSERSVLMQKATVAGAGLEPGVIRLDGEDRFAQLEQVQRDLALDPAVREVVRELVDAYRTRARAGFDPVILGYQEAGALHAYMIFTVVGELCWMEDLETRIERRGNGYARALLRSADTEAHRLGARLTGYTADESDWPWHWYRRLGWRVVGKIARLRRLR